MTLVCGMMKCVEGMLLCCALCALIVMVSVSVPLPELQYMRRSVQCVICSMFQGAMLQVMLCHLQGNKLATCACNCTLQFVKP